MEKGLFSCAHNFRFFSPVLSYPPEALGELPNIGIAIPMELLKGSASLGLRHAIPARAALSQVRMEGTIEVV